MDVVVLCGGLSSERDVSLASGSVVADALRKRGHRVVLMDLFFGYTGAYDDPADVFGKQCDIEAYRVKECEPDLNAIKISRNQDNDSLIGDNVIEICRKADITFLALHGDEGGKREASSGIRHCWN